MKNNFLPDKVPGALSAKDNTLFSQSWQLLEQLAGVAAMGRDLNVSLLKKDLWFSLQTLGWWCKFWVTLNRSALQSLQSKYQNTFQRSDSTLKISAKTHSPCDKESITFILWVRYNKGSDQYQTQATALQALQFQSHGTRHVEVGFCKSSGLSLHSKQGQFSQAAQGLFQLRFEFLQGYDL